MKHMFHIGPQKGDNLNKLPVVSYGYPACARFKNLPFVHLKIAIVLFSIKDAKINALQKLPDAYAIEKDMGK